VALGKGKYCSRACRTYPHQTAETFWQKVDRSGGPDACWLWTGVVNKTGYGRVGFQGKLYIAHRIALELTIGPLPDGLFACHTCDTPLCCNPRHLWAGTPAQNTREAIEKGRWGGAHRGAAHHSHVHPEAVPRGEQCPQARLTDDAVREIRRLYAAGGTTHAALAARFGVQPHAIGKVVRRERWKHVA